MTGVKATTRSDRSDLEERHEARRSGQLSFSRRRQRGGLGDYGHASAASAFMLRP